MTRMKRMRQRRKRIAFDDENMTRGEREKIDSRSVPVFPFFLDGSLHKHIYSDSPCDKHFPCSTK